MQDSCQSSSGVDSPLGTPPCTCLCNCHHARSHTHIHYTYSYEQAKCTPVIPTMWSDTSHQSAYQLALHRSRVETNRPVDTHTPKRSRQGCLTCAWAVGVTKVCSFLLQQIVTKPVITERAGKIVVDKEVKTLWFLNKVLIWMRYHASDRSLDAFHVHS